MIPRPRPSAPTWVVAVALSFAALACGPSMRSSTGTGATTGSTGAGGSNQPCLPTLFVPWQIVANQVGDPPITCSTAGATLVELDVNGTTYAQSCPPAASGDEFAVVLGGAGTYQLDGFLLDASDAVLSEAHPPAFSVSCADITTPTMILPVNL